MSLRLLDSDSNDDVEADVRYSPAQYAQAPISYPLQGQ